MPNYRDDVFEDYGFCTFDYMLVFNGSINPTFTAVPRVRRLHRIRSMDTGKVEKSNDLHGGESDGRDDGDNLPS